MNTLTKTLTFALCTALLLVFAPAAHAADEEGLSLRAAERYCNRASTREAARCQYNSRRSTGRLRSVHKNTRGRMHTLRDRRDASKNKPLDSIRSRAGIGINRTHDRWGGRSRRRIHESDRTAREICHGLAGTERYSCIRKRFRDSGNDNTQ